MNRKPAFAESVLSLCLLVVVVTASGRPLDFGKLHEADRAIDGAIDEGKLPGAVLWVEHGGDVYWKAYGNRALVPEQEEMTRDTIFDAASLTKVVATTPHGQ